MTLSPQDAFWIRNSYAGGAEGGVAELEPPPESVAAVASFLVDRGAELDDAAARAGFLLFAVDQMRLDVTSRAWGGARAVRDSAAAALKNIAALETLLASDDENRLFTALAKALVLDTEDGGPNPDILVMVGEDRRRLRTLLAGLAPLKVGLARVAEAHRPSSSRGGAPAREPEGEALAEMANHYIASTGRRPEIAADPIAGGMKGDFVEFARLICREVGAMPFSEHDLRKLRDRLPARAT